MDVEAVNKLVRTLYPPTTGQAILELLASRAGQVVGLEDMAIAAFGETRETLEYANSRNWQRAVFSRVRELRALLREKGATVDIETVRGRGYKLVARKPRLRPSRADTERWARRVLAQYDALRAEQPEMSLYKAHAVLAAKSRRPLYWQTFRRWLKQRSPERSTP